MKKTDILGEIEYIISESLECAKNYSNEGQGYYTENQIKHIEKFSKKLIKFAENNRIVKVK